MLIKATLAEKWYRTDSWVYNNFSFLFKNQLWDKDIPKGYSICPYLMFTDGPVKSKK